MRKLLLSALLALTLASSAFGLIVTAAWPQTAKALDNALIDIKDINFNPQVTIPGSQFQKQSNVQLSQSTQSIGEYIKAIYNYGVGVVGILAAIIIMVAGVIWLTAAGNESKIGEAKEWIGAAFTGMALVLLSYMLFKTINPNLVNLKVQDIKFIEKIVYDCCQLDASAGMMSSADCKAKNGTLTPNSIIKDNKCQVLGCCIAKLNNEPTSCIATLQSDCSLIGREAPTFDSKQCTEVTDCQNKLQTCEGKQDGDSCPGPWGDNGYCYKGKCFFGEAKKGELCGDSGKGTCVTSGNCETTDLLGRDCGSGLVCCKLEVGKEGEWCGNETGSKCYKSEISCTSDLGGRDCGSGLHCCKP